MAEQSKVAVNVCAGVDLEAFKGIKWHDKKPDGVPQVGELKDAFGNVISDAALIERIAAAHQCYTELQALFGGVKIKPTCQEKLAKTNHWMRKARKVAEDLEPNTAFSARGRLLNMLEE